MKVPTLAILVVSALWLAPTYAQQPGGPATQAPSAPAATVSDVELETFATIYVELLDIIAKFEPELASSQSDEQTQEIRGRMQEESLAKVAQRGWTPEKFNSVTNAINQNPELADKATRLIEAKI